MSVSPNPGQRVRVTYEATYHEHKYGFHRVGVMDYEGDECTSLVPADATVEVLEPADDPSSDPVWTVRTVDPPPYPGVDSNIVIKFGQDHWMYPYRNGYGRLDWAAVTSSRVVGVVPGTPAAEAQAPDPGPQPPVFPIKPRVFQSDGPEPPADVTVLEWLDFDAEQHGCRYLKRNGSGWFWTSVTTSDNDGVGWPWHEMFANGGFREVLDV